MPLAATFALQWYGPGLGAAVDLCTPSAVATVKGLGMLRAASTTAPSAYARINKGRPMTAASITAPTAYGRISARGRMAAVGRVNALSQDDVVGAIQTVPIEGDLTLVGAMRLLLSVLAGDATGLDGPSAAFKSLDGSKSRVTATLAAGARTVTGRDPA
jgi:hypothetical protein